MTGRSRQLPLDLAAEPDYGRDSFISGPSNAEALAFVERWPDWPAPLVLLTGPAGSGKTHLAHIWAERSGAPLIAADGLSAFSAHSELERGACIVEDIERDRVPEHALFHLINASREAKTSLLLTSRSPASDWQVSVPDLASRLRMAAPLRLEPPDDALLRQVLVKLFADRQLFVDRSVVDYLVVRMERSLASARAIVAALDREALSRGRRVTRAIAAEMLANTERKRGFPDEL